MKRSSILLAFFVLLGPARDTSAHVGSPNTFFQGDAGPYAIRAVIRPPGAVPGLAEISIRVQGEDIDRVSVLPGLVGDTALQRPPADEAKVVPGEPGFYSAELWFMDSGAYGVEIRIDGKRGPGLAVVPVTVASIARRPLPGWLAIVLALSGLVLLGGSIFIAGAAAREVGRSARVAMALDAVVVSALLAGFGGWWSALDRDFTSNQITKPAPVKVAVRTDGSRRVLELTPDRDQPGPSWTTLVPDHGKLMHIFLIHRTGLDAFAHIHPIQQRADWFDVIVPPLPRGEYEIYGDLTYENGTSQTLLGSFELPEAPPEGETPSSWAPDPDDSWTIDQSKASLGARVYSFGDGVEMRWLGSGTVQENDENALSFSLVTKDGQGVELQPYMGMLAHAAVRRADGGVFVHLHPIGTYSMASQEVIDRAAQPASQPSSQPSSQPASQPSSQPAVDPHAHHRAHATAAPVSFPYAFPSPGVYRIWVQMRAQDVVRTGIFDFEVAESK